MKDGLLSVALIGISVLSKSISRVRQNGRPEPSKAAIRDDCRLFPHIE
jgi:hypothetical protein